jgi:hypothetical protein
MTDAPEKPAEKLVERWCCNGNAEECALCIGTNPPYPFICPGDHADTPRNRRNVLTDATDQGREALKAAMRRLRVYDHVSKGRVNDSHVCETPHESVEEEEACEALRLAAQRARELITHPGEPSAVQAWADEADLAEALGSFGDGYRHAQRDAQIALGQDRIAAREAVEAGSGDVCACSHKRNKHTGDLNRWRRTQNDRDKPWCRGCGKMCEFVTPSSSATNETVEEPEMGLDGVSLIELRAHVSRRLVEMAQQRCVAEWICCDPIDPSHMLCVQGNAARTMITALLTDDATVFPPSSDLLDEVMRLVLGHADPARLNNVLSTAGVRELYGEAVARGLKGVVDWDGMDDLKPLKLEVIHTITAEVVMIRDRELARNRQRLLLADETIGRHEQDERLQAGFDEAMAARVRREERLKTLDEVAGILREENQTPYDTIALSGPMARLRKLRKDTERVLDKPQEG